MKREKRKEKRLRYGNMQKLLLLLFFLTPICSISQTVENINLPEGESGGTMVGDILYANGKIFAYSADGISVYDENSNSFLSKIFFKDHMPVQNPAIPPHSNFGKFNPVYHDARLAVPDQSIMVYNNKAGHEYVYALTPKLYLLIINTNDLDDVWAIRLQVEKPPSEVYLDEHLESQSGRVILKYDNNNGHDRLYMALNSRDYNNPTGNFHDQRSIFAIYEVDYNVPSYAPPIFDYHYSEITTPEPAATYGNQINNYVFNAHNNYFYIVRLGRTEHQAPNHIPHSIIEVREVVTDGTEPRETFHFNNVGGTGYYKMGKMLYIDDINNDVHKVVILPYKYFVGSVPISRYCVIDIDGTSHVANYFSSPSEKILDAVYLEDNRDLVLCYAPDNVDIINNISVLRYNSSAEEFEPLYTFDDDNSTVTSNLDINSPLYLTKLDGSTTLISKKDGIEKLEWDGNSYSYEGLLDAEGNCFRKGIVYGTKTYINNTVANGIEVYDNNPPGQFGNPIRTGYHVNHIIANGDGSRHIYFNKLNAHNTGLYCYSYYPAIPDPPTPASESIININSDNHTDNNIETAIGDVAYNQFKDHFLVSKFEKDNAKILILNASDYGCSGTIDLEAELQETQFATEMFVSPNGRLYIWANMNNDPNQNPTVFIYDATDYSFIKHVTTSGLSYNKDYTYCTAHFSYNPYDENVYTTIKVQEQKLFPYNTEASCIYNTDLEPETPPGELLVLSNEKEHEFDLDKNPGKVIFPGTEDNYSSSQYYGKLFIIGEKLYEYDYMNPWQVPSHSHCFIDITYSAVHDILFAVKEISDENSIEHKKFEIWTIYYDENGIQIELYNNDYLTDVDGQIANIFSNPYDGRVYVYQKIDAEKLGENDVSLYSFDPSDENPIWDITPLGFATYFPDYDHTFDLSMFYFHNTTTPYIDLYTSCIYLPNGGHSSISKVGFTATNDQLILDEGINWISIPRHDRPDPYVSDWTYIEDVFEQSDFTGGYSYLDLTHWHVDNSGEQMYSAGWMQNTQWTFVPEGEPDPKRTFSTRGYKLDLQQTVGNALNLTGTLEYPSTPIDLYGDNDNWVGYFLCESQSPFDAIPESVLDELTAIKAQGWCCVKQVEYHEGEPEYYWLCAVHEEDVILDYGDLVILTSDSEISFQWQGGGSPPSVLDKPETVHYQFNEQADYTSFMIDLDTSANPQEIGAFIGDSCVGASTVFDDDTIVLVPGYMEGMSGDVTFEEFYGSQKSQKPAIKEYLVRNNSAGTWQKRTIHTSERQDHYFISFKHVDVPAGTDADRWFAIFPNPADNMLNISYGIAEAAKVNISVFDGYGRRAATLMNDDKPAGSHTMQWDLAGDNGTKLPKGLYIIKIEVDDNTMSRKVVVN